jgi:uncharacterized protein (DUF305 family)
MKLPTGFSHTRVTMPIVAAIALGCTSPSGTAGTTAAPAPLTVQPGAPGTAGRTLSTDQQGALSRPAHTAADAAFMQGMIPHHQQALEMTALVAARTESRDIRLLALRIELSQQDEINLMKGWLRQRNEPVPGEGEHGAHVGHGLMPGMLTADEMAQLAAARGAEFDRLFLSFMIRHHEGALTMVAQLFGSSGGGQQTEIYQFAADVDADQSMEIARMKKLLEGR